MENPEHRRFDWKLFGWWVLASIVGLDLGFWLLRYVRAPGREIANLVAIGLPVPVVGIAQWLVLRKRIPRAGWWVFASTLGAYLGMAAAYIPLFVGFWGLFASAWYQSRLPDFQPDAMMNSFRSYALLAAAGFVLFGLLIGIAQWLVLRKHLRKAGWWICASTLGWVAVITWLGAALALSAKNTMDGVERALGAGIVAGIGQVAIPGAVLGVITGSTLAWLIQGKKPSARRESIGNAPGKDSPDMIGTEGS